MTTAGDKANASEPGERTQIPGGDDELVLLLGQMPKNLKLNTQIKNWGLAGICAYLIYLCGLEVFIFMLLVLVPLYSEFTLLLSRSLTQHHAGKQLILNTSILRIRQSQDFKSQLFMLTDHCKFKIDKAQKMFAVQSAEMGRHHLYLPSAVTCQLIHDWLARNQLLLNDDERISQDDDHIQVHGAYVLYIGYVFLVYCFAPPFMVALFHIDFVVHLPMAFFYDEPLPAFRFVSLHFAFWNPILFHMIYLRMMLKSYAVLDDTCLHIYAMNSIKSMRYDNLEYVRYRAFLGRMIVKDKTRRKPFKLYLIRPSDADHLLNKIEAKKLAAKVGE